MNEFGFKEFIIAISSLFVFVLIPIGDWLFIRKGILFKILGCILIIFSLFWHFYSLTLI